MKRSIYITVLLIIILSLALTACSSKQESEALRIATDATWPPFEYVDEGSKEIVGFDIDLMNAIAEDQGLEIEYVNTNWDALLAGMSECQFDAAISAMTITEERKEAFNFSEPYINAGQIIAVQIDNTDITSPEDLVGKTVGSQMGTTGNIEVDNIDGAESKPYDTVDLAFLDLMNGQIDAVIADYPTAVAFVGVHSEELKVVGDVFTDEYYGIPVCKDNTELLDKINAGLAAVSANGIIPELEQKWLAGASE